jgi:hypothetical protein
MMKMKPYVRLALRCSLIATGVLVLAGLPAAFFPPAFMQQQGGPYKLEPSVTPGGGGASSTCTKRIEGSIGQSIVGASSAAPFAAPFAVESGFWPNTPTCPLALSPTTQFYTPAGGAGSINVIAAGSCVWTASVIADWITLTSSDTGTGNDVVTFEVRENFTGAPRQTSINLGGLTQVLVQDAGLGDDCNYSISPQFESFAASGGSGTINVIAEERCAWQAVSTVGWITITSANVGVGNGTVAYCVEANPGTSGRSGLVITAGKTFAVKQKGQ